LFLLLDDAFIRYSIVKSCIRTIRELTEQHKTQCKNDTQKTEITMADDSDSDDAPTKEETHQTDSSFLPSWKIKRLEQRERNKARNRLLSIRHDVANCQGAFAALNADNVPIFGNARCGTWYTPTREQVSFKSTDGHTNDVSWKRLNLKLLYQHNFPVVIVDASRRKCMPDSFSRTLPLWAATMNQVVMLMLNNHASVDSTSKDSTAAAIPTVPLLYTPNTVVSAHEHARMQALVPAHAQRLLDSGVLVSLDAHQLARFLSKPLRCVWVTASATVTVQEQLLQQSWKKNDTLSESFSILVCVSMGDSYRPAFPNYSVGAADDEESWARGLTPDLFWTHANELLDDCTTHEETEAVMDRIVAARNNDNKHATSDCLAVNADADKDDKLDQQSNTAESYYNWIGTTGIAVGSRRAGRPPTCWTSFDAVLNVTIDEYDGIRHDDSSKYYLQMPVAEGKRDKTELERWLTVGVVFCIHHASHKRRVLVHCNQGKDRSVAVLIAAMVLFAEINGNWDKLDTNRIANIHQFLSVLEDLPNDDSPNKTTYGQSGLSCRQIDNLLGTAGKDRFFEWYRGQLQLHATQNVTSKETIRVALHVVQKYRTVAEPTRSTMQKLNRYFLSGSFEPCK
jgi:tRNA A64-2'-O-ribosylphosphate transferase